MTLSEASGGMLERCKNVFFVAICADSFDDATGYPFCFVADDLLGPCCVQWFVFVFAHGARAQWRLLHHWIVDSLIGGPYQGLWCVSLLLSRKHKPGTHEELVDAKGSTMWAPECDSRRTRADTRRRRRRRTFIFLPLPPPRFLLVSIASFTGSLHGFYREALIQSFLRHAPHYIYTHNGTIARSI